jgi:hypothetical protein
VRAASTDGGVRGAGDVPTDVVSRLSVWGAQQRSRQRQREQDAAQKKADAERSLTFHPKVNKAPSSTAVDGGHHEIVMRDAGDVAARCEVWNERRKAHLQTLRVQREVDRQERAAAEARALAEAAEAGRQGHFVDTMGAGGAASANTTGLASGVVSSRNGSRTTTPVGASISGRPMGRHAGQLFDQQQLQMRRAAAADRSSGGGNVDRSASSASSRADHLVQRLFASTARTQGRRGRGAGDAAPGGANAAGGGRVASPFSARRGDGLERPAWHGAVLESSTGGVFPDPPDVKALRRVGHGAASESPSRSVDRSGSVFERLSRQQYSQIVHTELRSPLGRGGVTPADATPTPSGGGARASATPVSSGQKSASSLSRGGTGSGSRSSSAAAFSNSHADNPYVTISPRRAAAQQQQRQLYSELHSQRAQALSGGAAPVAVGTGTTAPPGATSSVAATARATSQRNASMNATGTEGYDAQHVSQTLSTISAIAPAPTVKQRRGAEGGGTQLTFPTNAAGRAGGGSQQQEDSYVALAAAAGEAVMARARAVVTQQQQQQQQHHDAYASMMTATARPNASYNGTGSSPTISFRPRGGGDPLMVGAGTPRAAVPRNSFRQRPQRTDDLEWHDQSPVRANRVYTG